MGRREFDRSAIDSGSESVFGVALGSLYSSAPTATDRMGNSRDRSSLPLENVSTDRLTGASDGTHQGEGPLSARGTLYCRREPLCRPSVTKYNRRFCPQLDFRSGARRKDSLEFTEPYSMNDRRRKLFCTALRT